MPQAKSDFSCDTSIVSGNGIGLASQSHSVTAVVAREVGPQGSERWASDHGATNHVTDDPRNGWVAIPPGKETVLVGDGRSMRVLGVCNLNLRIHSKTDFHVKFREVYVTDGIGFNLFSLSDAQARQIITLDKDGARRFDGRLNFPRDLTGSSLFATPIDPTPSTKLTAVPALSGAPPPPLFSEVGVPGVEPPPAPLFV